MTATLALRTATAGDAETVAVLVNAAFRVERFFIDGDRTNPGDVRGLMEKGSFLLAEDVRGVAGCVYVEPRGERGYFGLLAVEPGRQARGLGRRLVAAAEDHLRQAGCRAADIQVVDLRTELPPLYRRLGYTETGRAPFPPDPRLKRPCHFILMSKPLA